MKAEPLTAITVLLLAAATAKDPIAYVCAGALAGAAIVAIMAPDLSPVQRLIRALVSLLTGITFAIGSFAVLGVWGHMSLDIATLQKMVNLRVDVLVGYAMSAVAFTFALLGYPVCLTIEKRAHSIIGQAVDARFGAEKRTRRNNALRNSDDNTVRNHNKEGQGGGDKDN